jgi:hypothetical protein
LKTNIKDEEILQIAFNEALKLIKADSFYVAKVCCLAFLFGIVFGVLLTLNLRKMTYKNALKSDMKKLWRHKFVVFFLIVAFFSEEEVHRFYWVSMAMFILIDNKITDIEKKLDCILEAQSNDK